jgi:prepilin-type N-terminal cleavage/methylation domain-containing protein
MKRFISLSNNRRGFTLIELLVVVAILGILAVALLATIDPFEQIKRANDSNMEQVATEVVEANVRYYSTHNALPWWSVSSGGKNCYSGSNVNQGGPIQNSNNLNLPPNQPVNPVGTSITEVTLSNLTGCMQDLINEGELKQGFLNSNYLGSLYLTNPDPYTGNATDTAACFQPTSKAGQQDSNTKFQANGSLAASGSCISAGGQTACYWCTE